MQRTKHFRIATFSLFLGLLCALSAFSALGQTTSGVVKGVVKDTTGALVPGATIELRNLVSGYSKTVTSDGAGQFSFPNVPFNPYRLTASKSSLHAATVSVQISNPVPVSVNLTLALTASETVDVEATADLTETDPNFHTDIDRATIARLPVEAPTSELSSIVTELTPGVAADSNGLLHGLGDHNEVSFVVDGEPITDQQSKVFSNQLPADAVQSFEVIEGAPPAEYGDKTSLVIVATTRSGQGVKTPTGVVSAQYGSFGTSRILADMAYGGQNWGNFISASALQSGRFLDTPEFAVYHDKGNEENLFDRIDNQFSKASSMHTDFQYTRSLFATPNSYDTEYGFVANGLTSGATDQRSKIQTILIAPTYTRIIGSDAVFNFAPYLRRDSYNYIPSPNLLNDLGPIQQESVAQQRSLTNAGVHSDLSYTKGPNSFKLGGLYEQTFLRENDTIGIVDSGLNEPCLDVSGKPTGGSQGQCSTPGSPSGSQSNPIYPILAPYDLTTGGTEYTYHGHTDVKQLAFYGEDSITAGSWNFNLGIRGDIYNGLAIQRQAEPRAGISYNIKKTQTVLRVSYARTQETPFNENLVLSSQGCLDPVLQAIFTETFGYCTPAPFNPGFRNEFHAGFEQGFGKRFVMNAEWITKYTHNGYDFSVLGATPITFPIEWHNSKIPGYALSGTMTEVKGLTARVTFSSVVARFFNPQIGGVGATIASAGGYPFRIDHDERFNQSTHLEYKMPFRKSLYYSFNWRFDSGLVAGSTPCYNVNDPNSACAAYSFAPDGVTPLTVNGVPAINLSSFTADEEFQAGLTCDGVKATQTQAIMTDGQPVCDAAGLTSRLVKVPAPGTEDDDHNPQRIQPRNLFDMELGDENVAHFGPGERYKFGVRLTAINATNKYALYNFLSTFSGTHYVSPRTVTGEIAFRF